MTDIAVEAGVSRSTVSLVLNNKHASVGIPETTRTRVLHAASQLGYHPNEVARAMVTGKNRVLVYLLHNPAQEVTARILAGAWAEAEKHGYLIKLVGREGILTERDIERCVELRPVGVMAVYTAPFMTAYLQKELARYQIPLVLLDSSFPASGVARVLSDDIAGMHQAVAHLHALGHKRIAHLSGPAWSGAAVLRAEGYRKAMAHFDLPVPADYLVDCEWQISRAEQATHQLLFATHPRPTAFVCADDKLALTAARIATKNGLRVPKDLSLVGFADLEMASYGNPPLTTIAQPFADLGSAAVRGLLAQSPAGDAADILLPTRLIVRDTTMPPPHRENPLPAAC